MKRTHPKSQIEVWSGDYLNRYVRRRLKDVGAKILQVECGSKAGTYIVEFVDRLDLQ